jgi:hypothetical protein
MAPQYNSHGNNCCEVDNFPAPRSEKCQIDHSTSEQDHKDISFNLVSSNQSGILRSDVAAYDLQVLE